MNGIQKQASELAEEWKNSDCSDLRELERNGDKMAALLRQIASMGGDVTAPVAQVLTVQQHQRVILRDPVIWIGPIPHGESLYTRKQLDAARLAGFEAGRRKGLEDAASVCEKISDEYGYRESTRCA